ncbi:hypothetical protein [Mucilaginibacter flavus]|uniref:hypothetical protein n=1 Tax=Mucilaginibacter flavus TaxID=931504 RepID=UPI0025B42472|nr:hypothetical protein [Mucilaginibacter flavus]MDN3584630.1 hypothetical protein [Mucilaginibacter flavus]
MKLLLCLVVISGNAGFPQTINLSDVRNLYCHAALVKQDAQQLSRLLIKVDSNAEPVLFCYKGANEMISARYSLNPVSKLEKFSKGKQMMITAINRDTLNLEMRFIRYSIQSNLPAFLGYHEELNGDKRFLTENISKSNDSELRQMINNYLSIQSKQKTN